MPTTVSRGFSEGFLVHTGPPSENPHRRFPEQNKGLCQTYEAHMHRDQQRLLLHAAHSQYLSHIPTAVLQPR